MRDPAPDPASPTDRPGLFTRPALAAARRPRATLAAWAALVIVGLYAAFSGLDREGFPPIDIPIAVVETTWFVDDAGVVDTEIAQPVRSAWSEVDGVEQIRTYSRPNGFTGVVEFGSSFTSPDGVAALIAAPPPAVPDAVELDIRPIDATKFDDEYDLVVSVIGPPDASADQLEEQADRVASALDELGVVARAEPLTLQTEAVDPATGETVVRRTSFTRYADGGDTTATEAIGVGVVREPDAAVDVIAFSDAVADRLDAGVGLDEPYRAVIGADLADDIRAQLHTLSTNLLAGLVAVAVVSLLLIGWRTAVLTAAFMATVVLASLTGLWLIGASLNTVTLFGLILTLGLLVDDAIVISESIDASRGDPTGPDPGPLGVLRTAVDRVGAASFAGTLSTVTVLAPMLFISGVLGEFIRSIPITVILTLTLSFLLSITLIPTLGRLFILAGPESRSPLVRAQEAAARGLGRLAAYPAGHGVRGWLVWLGLVGGAVALIVSSFATAGRLGFNIFPPTKDSNGLQISADFPEGTTIDEAREVQAELDRIVLGVLGDDAVRYQVVSGDERGSFAVVELVPFDERSTTSPAYVERIEAATAGFAGALVAANPVDVGPPPDEFPFQVQLRFSADQADAASILASDMATTLPGRALDKVTGDPTRIVSAFVASEGQIWRRDGEQFIEVRANFDTDDTTSNLAAAEDLVHDLYPSQDLVDRGLSPDALGFDFGIESDNQDDFASLGVALLLAIGLMILFLAVQFRSIVHPLLVFLAVPFGFFGVFTLLEVTDNPISFFVGIGFIALVGVAVNNTILLVDAANQLRRDGASPAAAIGGAVQRRFRPLLATTATTVVGLLPLALGDPFWEALCYVLIGGLVSSTVLVLTAFPALYLVVETARARVLGLVRR